MAPLENLRQKNCELITFERPSIFCNETNYFKINHNNSDINY